MSESLPTAEKDAPALCRTCLRLITHETRVERGRFQREGWYDDAPTDPIVCFKARDYRHVPLTDRERAYYDAGAKAGARAAGRAIEAWATENEIAAPPLDWGRLGDILAVIREPGGSDA